MTDANPVPPGDPATQTTSTPSQPPAAPTPPAAAPAAPTPPTPPAPPAWQPPRSDSGRYASVIFGVILLVIGLWFFAERTLGIDLPSLDWGKLWPLFLIGLGLWVVLGSLGRRR